MSPDPRPVLCGELAAGPPRAGAGPGPLRLAIGDGRRDVHLRLDQLTAAMRAGVPDVAADLLELAAYVYAADQAVTRGGTKGFDYGGRWRRAFRLAVPVRRPDVWGRPAVREALRDALVFLTDDDGYEFDFPEARRPRRPDAYLFDGCPAGGADVEEVVLFSGGLDSLCGAVDEVLVGRRRVALVSHRPSNPVYARQRALAGELKARLGRPDLAPVHVAVTVNEGGPLNRDFTQRTRSFLFAAAAAVVARQVGLGRIRFYENGVTSLNLPISPQLTGARASRTTHPQALARLGKLFSLVFDAPFEVQNPYQWATKAELLSRLKALGHADLAARAVSCVRTREQSAEHPHCGRCSQCVDRRLSALAAGLSDAEDPPGGYRSDVLTGARAGTDLTLVERYVGSAFDLEGVGAAVAFAGGCGEVSHAVPYVGLAADAAAGAVFDLQRRHAEGVRRGVRAAAAGRLEDVVRQAFPADSLLGVVVGRAGGGPAAPAARPAATAAAAEAEGPFVVDPGRFEVRVRGLPPCPLGNTKEFALVERLWRAGGTYLSVQTLRDDVWEGGEVEKNTVQKFASNARRMLREAGFAGVSLDGIRDHYRLVVGGGEGAPPARRPRRRQPSA